VLYPRILDAVSEPWLIRPDKAAQIAAALSNRLQGLRTDAASLEALAAQNRSRAATSRPSKSIAVLPILGTLVSRGDLLSESSGMASMDRLGRDFAALVADPGVGHIVLDVDSPGGTVAGTEELAAQIFAARGAKPVTAVVNHQMASAAFWIGSAAREVVISPSGQIGSVGVVKMHVDWSDANLQHGVKVTYIYAGKFKTEGNPDEPMTEEAIAYHAADVEASYNKFVDALAAHRGTTPGDVRKNYGEGRMLDAKAAKAAGMVDRIGTLEETIGRIAAGARPSRSRAAAMRMELEARKA